MNPDFDGSGMDAIQTGGDVTSVPDTYEVEDIGVEMTWLRCRRCGHTWRVFDGSSRGSWRCPHEPHTARDAPSRIDAF